MGLFSRKKTSARPAAAHAPVHSAAHRPATSATAAPGTFAPPPGPPPGQAARGAPPGYAAAAVAPIAGFSAGTEQKLQSLAKYDTWFIIDDSESMEMWWDDVTKALRAVVDISVRYDADGIDMSFFNSDVVAEGQRSAQDVLALFRRVEPRKSTPTRAALTRVLSPYIERLEAWKAAGPAAGPRPKPLNVIVLTDGEPDRDQDPEDIIVEAARRLDAGRWPPYQLGIQFVQIGDDDMAAAHLQSLDDDLKTRHKIRDLVDTTLFTRAADGSTAVDPDYIMKALLGGINKTIDNKGV